MRAVFKRWALAAAVVAWAGTSACSEEQVLEVILTGSVSLAGTPHPFANLRRIPTSGARIDVVTDDQGDYRAVLQIGVEYTAFPFGLSGAALCPEVQFVTDGDEMTTNFDCVQANQQWDLSCTYESDSCGFGNIDPFTAAYDWVTPSDGGVRLDHTDDAPPLSGTWNDESRSLAVSTEWIPVDDDTEIMDVVMLDLDFFSNTGPSLQGRSETTARQLSTGATCLVSMLVEMALTNVSGS